MKYKYLKKGIVREGDEYYSSLLSRWMKCSLLIGDEIMWNVARFRRPLPAKKRPSIFWTIALSPYSERDIRCHVNEIMDQLDAYSLGYI